MIVVAVSTAAGKRRGARGRPALWFVGADGFDTVASVCLYASCISCLSASFGPLRHFAHLLHLLKRLPPFLQFGVFAAFIHSGSAPSMYCSAAFQPHCKPKRFHRAAPRVRLIPPLPNARPDSRIQRALSQTPPWWTRSRSAARHTRWTKCESVARARARSSMLRTAAIAQQLAADLSWHPPLSWL